MHSSNLPYVTVHESPHPLGDSCSIRVSPMGRFGGSQDPITMADVPVVQRDSSGRLYEIVPHARTRELTVRDPGGVITGTIGAYGNEFLQFIRDISIGEDDTLVVFHDHRRVSIFDPSGGFVRGFQLDSDPRMAQLIGSRAGRVLLSVGSRAASLPPLQLYDERGRLEASFGPHGLDELWEREQGRQTLGGLRHASWDPDGSVWLAGPGYRIERCDLGGSVDRVIGVRGPANWYTEWFSDLFMTLAEYAENRRRYPPGAAAKRPLEPFVIKPAPVPLTVMGMHRKGEWLLTLSHVFSPGTSDKPIPHVVCDPTKGCGQPIDSDSIALLARSRDTVLDVIDVSTGAVLARTHVRGRCQLTSDGTLYRSDVDDDGVVCVELFEIEVRAS